MIKDLIKNTKINIDLNNIKTLNDISKTNSLTVDFSNKIKISINEIRYFLKTKMYNNKNCLKKK